MEKLVKFQPEFFRQRKVFITGHTGFKGTWLTLWLNRLHAKITGFSLPVDSGINRFFHTCSLREKVAHFEGDIRDFAALKNAMDRSQPELVIHLAAQALVRKSYQDPLETVSVNTLGTLNLLEAVRHNPSVKAVLVITSDKCYRNKEWVWGYRETDELGGEDPYSASKAAAENLFYCYLHSFFKPREDLGAGSARAGNVIGGGDWSVDRIIPDIVRALESGNPITIRNPRSTRPWQHVLDVIHGYLALSQQLFESPAAFSGSWNFGPGDSGIKDVETLAHTMIGHWGAGTISLQSQPGDPPENRILQLCADKSRTILNWSPKFSFSKAIEETATWYKRFFQGENPLNLSLERIEHFEAYDSGS